MGEQSGCTCCSHACVSAHACTCLSSRVLPRGMGPRSEEACPRPCVAADRVAGASGLAAGPWTGQRECRPCWPTPALSDSHRLVCLPWRHFPAWNILTSDALLCSRDMAAASLVCGICRHHGPWRSGDLLSVRVLWVQAAPGANPPRTDASPSVLTSTSSLAYWPLAPAGAGSRGAQPGGPQLRPCPHLPQRPVCGPVQGA